MLEPIYDDKVIKILELFEKGLTREEAAEHFRYASFRSMDEYMRRKNFRWDKRDQTYVAANVKRERVIPRETDFPTEKIRRVVREFEKEMVDPKEIAQKLGFKNHFKMAEYMTSKGFEWSSELKNYVSSSNDSSSESSKVENNTDATSVPQLFDVSQSSELLHWLAENKNAIQTIIDEKRTGSGTIPRFTLPGTFMTKSVHMTSLLNQIVRDFSEEKNINQREIFEVALIEFFQKYGFEHEVDSYLQVND